MVPLVCSQIHPTNTEWDIRQAQCMYDSAHHIFTFPIGLSSIIYFGACTVLVTKSTGIRSEVAGFSNVSSGMDKQIEIELPHPWGSLSGNGTMIFKTSEIRNVLCTLNSNHSEYQWKLRWQETCIFHGHQSSRVHASDTHQGISTQQAGHTTEQWNNRKWELHGWSYFLWNWQKFQKVESNSA